MGIEGRLNIRLRRIGRAIDAVRIESTRPVHASRVFTGKTVAESQRMIPLLFNICATAQACACARACEQALGVQATAHSERLRDDLVDMETLREHLWRILLDWPAFTGAQADRQGMVEVVAMQREHRQALCRDGDVFQLGGAHSLAHTGAVSDVRQRLAKLQQQQIFGMPSEQWLALTRRSFTDWAADGSTVAAAMIEWIKQNGWSGAGACRSEPLPRLAEQQLHRVMQNADYVEQPKWDGLCRETSSLTRVDSPLLRALQQEFTNGLLVRLVARLTEIARLAGRLMTDPPDGAGEAATDAAPRNPGIGQAVAARGRLVHRVALDGDIICGYQILAPTEWNFHPQGVAAQALGRLRGDPDALEMQARLLVNAIDPCVAYGLTIE